MSFDKVIRIGLAPAYTAGGLTGKNVYCHIQYDDKRLSITGVHGPKGNGDAFGSCGQIIETLGEVTEFAPGWSPGLRDQFATVWSRWHLNDMRAGSPAQSQWLRDNPHDPKKHFGDYYAYACQALSEAGLNPDNGYRYGSAWLHEDVPADVLAFLTALPDSDLKPAWV